MARVLVLGGFAESLVNFRGDLLREMVKHGHEVIACAPHASVDVQSELFRLGVTYRHVDMDRTGINPIHDLDLIRRMISLFRELKPDVFLAYTIKPVIYGSIAARLAGVSKVFSIITGLGYTFMDQSLKGTVLRAISIFLYRIGLKHHDKVFFQNPDDMELFGDLGLVNSSKQAVSVHGSGVDIERFRPASFPEAISFLLIARLLQDKGIHEYAEAAKIVKHHAPHVRFFLAGWIDSNPRAIDKEQLQAWQDSGAIEYLGKLSDVREAIAGCSVYVLPSYREGTPRTVLEAMAMGRPVITTDVPGCRETVVDGKNGLLVPAKDSKALADAMLSFVYEPGMIAYMGEASRRIASEKYDVRKVNAQILAAMSLV